MRQFFVPLAVVLIDKRFYGGTNCPIIPFYEVRLGVVSGSVPYFLYFVLGGQMLELRAGELSTIIRDYTYWGTPKTRKSRFSKIGTIEEETALFSGKRSENLVNQSLTTSR